MKGLSMELVSSTDKRFLNVPFSVLQLSGVWCRMGNWSTENFSDYDCSIANIVRGEWYSR